MDLVFAVVISDGLRFASGNVVRSGKAVLAYCRVPEVFTEGEFEAGSEELWPPGKSIQADTLERFYEALYGSTWRRGNEDGSAYTVLSVEMRAHRPDQAWALPENTGPDAQFTRHYFVADVHGVFRVARPEAVVVAV